MFKKIKNMLKTYKIVRAMKKSGFFKKEELLIAADREANENPEAMPFERTEEGE